MANFANVLNTISFQARDSVLGDRLSAELQHTRSTTGSTDSEDIKRIQAALNKLDGRGEDKKHKPRFLVSLLPPLPEYAWATGVIKIIDNLHGTTILINPNYGLGKGMSSPETEGLVDFN